MLLSITILAVMLTGSKAPQQSLLKQVVPNPTGNNGYEDYLKAVDIVNDTEAAYYIAWRPGVYEKFKKDWNEQEAADDPDLIKAMRERLAFYKRLEGKTLLEVRTEAVRKYGRAFELLHAGNQKRVWDPRTSPAHIWTIFPEYASFKQLAKFADMAAYVAFAEGRGRDGCRLLIDTLQMGQNLEGGIMISHLVGIAIESIALAGFEQYLPNVSRADAAMIEGYIAKIVAGEPKVIAAIKSERATTLAVIEDAMNSTDLGDPGGGDTESAKLAAKFRAMTPSSRQALMDRAATRLNNALAPIVQRFYGPESEWIPAPRTPEQEEKDEDDFLNMDNPQQFVDSLVDSAALSLESLGAPCVKGRTQLRLLGLHAAVLRYKWDNGVLPASLEEVVPANQMNDPLSGQKFVFERQGLWGFRIYSMGTKTTGEIALKYRKPLTTANDTDPVPPR